MELVSEKNLSDCSGRNYWHEMCWGLENQLHEWMLGWDSSVKHLDVEGMWNPVHPWSIAAQN